MFPFFITNPCPHECANSSVEKTNKEIVAPFDVLFESEPADAVRSTNTSHVLPVAALYVCTGKQSTVFENDNYSRLLSHPPLTKKFNFY